MRKEGGPENPEMLVILNNLAMIYQQLDDLPKARQILEDALVGKQKYFGRGHSRTATGHHNLAQVLRASGEYEGAIVHHELGIAIVDTIEIVRESYIYIFMAGYGNTLLAQERFDEARSVYEQCYPPMADSYGLAHKRVTSIADSLAVTCDLLGDKGAAISWRNSGSTALDK
jgi:tetratricopeptide (TPR) repeat protein